MTIFAVLMPTPQAALSEKIVAEYPSDSLQINDQQWLISASGSVIDVCARIGIVDSKDLAKPSIGNAVVFATSSYYGRGPATTWDWIKSKLQPDKASGG